MNIYLISQNYNNSWDTYDSAVVVTESEDIAKRMHPHNGELDVNIGGMFGRNDWAVPEYVEVEYLGKADDSINERKVICSSFNAG